MEIERVISHPSYNSSTYQNDIAILKLKENVAENGRYLSNIFIVELKIIIKRPIKNDIFLLKYGPFF